ncbi:MAG: phage portal protein [Chloroflexi bacterium]|nr:MAG: phage portal protein [Chloroflexota bacterium]
MPTALEYLPHDKEQRAAADKAFEDARALMEKYVKYYQGKHKAHFKNSEDNVVINLCRIVVDAIVDFLMPQMPKIVINDDGIVEEAEAYLENIWVENGGANFLRRLAQIGSIYGHVFVRVWFKDDGKVNLYPIQPQNVIVFYDPDDHEVLWYEQRWSSKERGKKVEYRQDIVRQDGIWLIHVYKRNKGVGQWEKVETQEWRYPISPLVDWAHLQAVDRYTGESELRHAELNDQINAVASDIKAILRHHASPRVVGFGFQTGEVQETAINGLWTIPNPDARVEVLQGVPQLDAAQKFYDTLVQSFLSESKVVLLPSDIRQFSNVTNLGIRATYLQMLSKIEVLRRNYERGIRQICRLIGLVNLGTDLDVQVLWADALPTNMIEQLTLIERQIGLGLMSRQTASKILGLDYGKEQRQIDIELLNDTGNGFEPSTGVL